MPNSHLTIDEHTVRKHYLRTERDQPAREWRALSLLHEHAPGLAPQPLAREQEPPVVTMSRVPGSPLEGPHTADQTAAMVAAFRTLFASPLPADLPTRHFLPRDFVERNSEWIAESERDALPDVVRRALDAAARWHDQAPDGTAEIGDPVMTQGDSNTTNMLWDGHVVRLIDFEYSGVGDLAFEVADLVEHISSRLPGTFDPDVVLDGLDLTAAQRGRVEDFRVVLATFWLVMLLPGNPGHHRNPPGSMERQAGHLMARL